MAVSASAGAGKLKETAWFERDSTNEYGPVGAFADRET